MDNQVDYNDDGIISVRFDYLLDAMSNQAKLDLIERLSCEEAVIKHVADQITDTLTENGFRGSRMCGAQSEPTLPLDAAARQVAKYSSDIARKEIEQLEKALAASQKRFYELADEMDSIKRSRY